MAIKRYQNFPLADAQMTAAAAINLLKVLWDIPSALISDIAGHCQEAFVGEVLICINV